MAKKKVYVCFDYERDRDYKFLLEAWNFNPHFEFTFNDRSPREILSNNISVVKACLTKKIQEADYTLVLAGKDANKLHKEREYIGYRNWQNYEVARSVANNNRLVIVELSDYEKAPEECYGHNAVWAGKYSQENILKGINEAAGE